MTLFISYSPYLSYPFTQLNFTRTVFGLSITFKHRLCFVRASEFIIQASLSYNYSYPNGLFINPDRLVRLV